MPAPCDTLHGPVTSHGKPSGRVTPLYEKLQRLAPRSVSDGGVPQSHPPLFPPPPAYLRKGIEPPHVVGVLGRSQVEEEGEELAASAPLHDGLLQRAAVVQHELRQRVHHKAQVGVLRRHDDDVRDVGGDDLAGKEGGRGGGGGKLREGEMETGMAARGVEGERAGGKDGGGERGGRERERGRESGWRGGGGETKWKRHR